MPTPTPAFILYAPVTLRRHSRFSTTPLTVVRPSRSSPRPTRFPTPRASLAALPLNPKVLQSSLSATSKLLATLFLGVVAAKRNLLPPETLNALSKAVFSIFLPSLLFTNILRTLALSTPTPGLFFLPLAAFTQVLFGLLLGLSGSLLLRLKDRERRLFLVCCGFGNSAALPLLFASALFDTNPQHLAQLISSISFFLIGWTGLFWSVGYSALAGYPSDDPTPGGVPAAQIEGDKKGVSGGKNFLRMLARRILSPPLVAAFSALAIGLSPFSGIVIRSPFFAALKTLGAGYSPAAVLILAGSLARKVEKKKVEKGEGLRMPRLVIGICICRYVLMPFLGLAILRFGTGVFRTPFVRLAILLEAVMPPAQNSTLILNLEGKPNAAASMARILLVVYLIGVLPISLGLTYFLGISGV